MAMKVRELIEHLAQFDGEMEVMFQNIDDEGTPDEYLPVNTVEMREDTLHGDYPFTPTDVVVVTS